MMNRQFGSLLLGLFIVIGMVSAAHGSVLPESSLTLGSVLADDSANSTGPANSSKPEGPPTLDLGTEEAPALDNSGQVNSNHVHSSYSRPFYYSYGNYFQTAYSQGYETGKRLLSKGCCSHCHCFGCSCYTWRAYAGALFWSRTSPGGGVAVREYGIREPSVLLRSKNYDFGWNNGWEVGLARRLSCIWAAEARFYRIDSFDAGCPTFDSDNGAEVPYLNQEPPGAMEGDCSICSNYSSELTNLELNLRRNLSQRIDFIFGFRYLQLNDRYRVSFANNYERAAEHSIHAFNNMYGFHFGPDVCLISHGPFCAEWGARIGVYGNRINTGVCVGVTEPNSDENSISYCRCRASQDHTAFSADMTLAGTYQYNDCLAFRFGYQVLWLEGVGEATSQIGCSRPLAQVNGSNNLSRVDTDGSPFYHGAFVDIVLTW